MARNRRQGQDEAQNSTLSCEMCLTPDDPAEMLHIDVERADGAKIRTAVLCRRCIAAILTSAKRLMESETEETKDDEPDPDDR